MIFTVSVAKQNTDYKAAYTYVFFFYICVKHTVITVRGNSVLREN